MKNIKKIILIIVVILLIAAIAVGMYYVKYIKPEQEKAKDFWYIELDDGTLEIYKYVGNNETVNIPKSLFGKDVTVLNGCFADNKTIQEVNIPLTVKEISRAFENASNLKKVTGGENVETITFHAFYNCTSLESIPEFPNLKFLQDKSFRGCTSLKSVVLPEGLEYIGINMFYRAKNLSEIVIPKSVKYIDISAFKETPWYDSLPINTVVGDAILLNPDKSQKDMYIEEGIKFICDFHIKEEDKTENIYIPDTVEEINGIGFFLNSNVRKVYIPSSVKHVYLYVDEGVESPIFMVEENSYAHEYLLEHAEEDGLNCEIVDDVQAIYESTFAESQSK